MSDLKTSQFGTITSAQANSAGVEGYLPYIDPSQVDPDLRNKRMTRSEAKKFFGLDPFTSLSGTSWDGSNKTLTLTSNIALTFSSTKRNGILRVTQDATGSRTLSINAVSVPISSGANTISVISFFYDDIAATYVFSVDTNILGNVGGGGVDTTPPTLVSGNATDSTHVTLIFSETVVPTVTGWSLYEAETTTTYSFASVSGSGTTWTFVLASGTLSSGNTLTVNYNATTGNTTDTALNELATLSNFSITNGIGGGSYDTDAQAGFTRIETTLGATITTTEKNAVNDLIVALKAASVWTKINHLECYCGSTAAAMMTNYKNPAANGTASDGSPSVVSTGLKFTGGTDAENTGVDYSALGTNNVGVTFLIQEAIQNIFVGNDVGVTEFKIYNSDGVNLFAYPHIGALSSGIAIPSIAGGLHTYQRNGGILEHYRGSSFIGSSSDAFSSWGSPGNILLHKFSTSIHPSDTTVGLFICHTAFTSSEQSAITTAINSFRTALSR